MKKLLSLPMVVMLGLISSQAAFAAPGGAALERCQDCTDALQACVESCAGL